MKKLFIPVIVLLAGLLMSVARAPMTPNDKLRLVESLVTNYYVDTVNEDKIVEAAIIGMLKELDPHSSYSNPEETKAMNEPLEGSFSGVGISYNMNQDTLYVLQVVSGGPSERVGILPGDRVIAVDDSVIAGVKMTTAKIMKKLRGPKGTKVNMKILRRTTGKPDQTIDFLVTRAEIPIHSVDVAYMADDNTGYIRLNKFAATTPEEFMEAVLKLRKKGMKDLILDLTDNGGGYLSAATSLLGEMLEPGALTVYTEGENSRRQEINATPRNNAPLLGDGRLVVMINQYSASASEILSGAVQDWDRGLTVGRRSFGKGLVQRPFPFPDGSMVRLTIAHYYTPTGRDIQKPYVKGKSKEYANDIMTRYNNGELMHADSIHYADSLKVSTLRLGRPIYGGGGISPDVFVPLDTTFYTDYYRDLNAKGLINQYAIRYTDTHRKQLKKDYKNVMQFVNNFTVTDEMIDQLVALAEKEGVKPKPEQMERSKPVIKNVIKAIIGRDIIDDEAFYRILNEQNDIFKEALKLINSPEYDTMLPAAPKADVRVTSRRNANSGGNSGSGRNSKNIERIKEK